jgi:hypothetical protein
MHIHPTTAILTVGHSIVMPAPDPSQCALAADGSLLDASDIIFYNDPDDLLPLYQPATEPSMVHPFFTGASAPVTTVVGSRRSGCVIRPSTRVTDPDNVEALHSRKRAAPTMALTKTSARRTRPRINDSEDGSEVGEVD